MPIESAQSSRLRQKRSWIAGLLLPAILFRALVPAGFMPAFDADGALSLQFCTGTDQAAAGARPLHEHHHDGAAGDTGDTGRVQPPCPFAATASSAPPPAMAAIAIGMHDALQVAARPVSRHTIPTIVRTQSPRAPPVPA